MQIFGIGLPEMAVIAAIGLLVFGPKRLPELGKTLGSTLRGFQKASEEFQQEFQQAIQTEERPGTPASLPPRPDQEAVEATATPGSAPVATAAAESASSSLQPGA